MSPRPAGILGVLLSPSFALVLALLLALGLVFAPRAMGDASVPSLDGAWNMTAVSETFTVQQWSPTCGPAPITGTGLPGGVVRVRSEGAEFAIEGGRRTLRSDGCIDGMPSLASEAHSVDATSWRTRCSTPASDPRRATVNTAYFLASADTIQLAETGRYELTINRARCIADVKREGSLRKIPAPMAPSPSTAPSVGARARLETPASSTSNGKTDCMLPGAATRLEVRPSRKLLRVGDTFGFRAVVVDAEGCPTGTPIQWTIGSLQWKDGQTHTALPAVDGTGKLTVPRDCADATFNVVATAAGRNARSAVDVTSPATYEALLAQSGLGPSGERDDPVVVVLATESIGAADVRAEDGARRRRTIFIVIVVALALSLGALAVVGAARSRKARAVEQAAESRHAERMRDFERQKREREEAHAAQLRAHLESVADAQRATETAAARGIDSGPMFCPSCRREFSGGGAFCPFDSNRLVAIVGHQELLSGPSGGICPTCRRGFNPGIKVCPHDGDELVPSAMVTTALAPPLAVRGKICPTCGGRFDGTAGFCGKDGTQLVLLN